MARRSRPSLKRLMRLADGPYPALTVLYGRWFLECEPDFWLAWQWVGEALFGQARYEEAEQALAKAIELAPPDKRSHPLSMMGHLFREAGDWEQAATWYRRAIAADPTDAGPRIYLGAALAKAGRHHEAEEAHRSATACDSGCIDEAYLNLGLVLRALGRFAEAAACFEETLRRAPDDRLARRALRDVELCRQFRGC